jgi:hypothetical protein
MDYQKIYKHLKDKNMEFCFVEGVLISRDDCKKFLFDETTKKIEQLAKEHPEHYEINYI